VGGDLRYARTLLFAVIGTKSLFYVFSSRTLEKPMWKVPLTGNPSLILAVFASFLLQLLPIYHPNLAIIFDTVPLHITDWVIVFVVGLLIVFGSEGIKHLLLKRPHSA
jgi:Ca2+-transporting ATPase